MVYRPEYYAKELLASISNLLNIASKQMDEGVSSILLDTLSILCESKVVDMVSTWNALIPQFKHEQRNLALSAYCRFMSVVTKLDHLNNPESEVNSIR